MIPRRALAVVLPLSLALAACDTSPRPRSEPATSAKAPVTPAPAPMPEAGGVRFISRITGGAAESDPLPLVIAIHGLGSRPEDFVDVYAQLGARARLVVPYGLEPYHGGYTWFEVGSAADPEKLALGSSRAASKLAAMIEELSRRYPTRGKAVVTGFSQGGMLSYALAVLHPELVRAAFPVGGILAKPLWPGAWPKDREMPRIRAYHGTSDERIAIDGDRATIKHLKEIGLPAEMADYVGVGHTITPEMRRDLRRAIDDALRE